MSGREIENFYNQDERKYIVKENTEFLKWYQEQLEKDYYPYLDLDQIQGLINELTRWYEIKYPDALLEKGSSNNMKIISKELTIDQLKFRITHDERETLDCDYRGTSFCGQLTGISVYKKNIHQRFPIMINVYADKNGLVAPENISELEEFLPKFTEPIALTNILKILKEKNHGNLDITELEKCILTHQLDLELRNRILSLASLSLLYSNMTIPEKGFVRAKKLINEFNEYYHLNLGTDELTQIMLKNYQEIPLKPSKEKEAKEDIKPKSSILRRIRKMYLKKENI